MTSSTSLRTANRLLVCSILIIGSAISFIDINGTPAYIGGDEAHFATQAYSLATTARDLSGRFMPLFFNLTDPRADPQTQPASRWYQPLLFYSVALALKIAGFNETAVRLPTALIAVLDGLLIYAVARRLFPGTMLPAVSALLLIMCPAHVILSRQATDYICSLPFVLGWLWCTLKSNDEDSAWFAFAAGLVLGIGFYSYLAAWIMTPLYLCLTWVAQFLSTRRPGRLAIATGIGFAVPLLPLGPWLWSHPEMLGATLSRYGVNGAGGVGHSLTRLVTFGGLQDKVSTYWDYFNPAFLFLVGGVSLTASTLRVGVFLLPTAPFLVYGAYLVLTDQRRPANTALLIGGLVSSPLAATMAGERYMIQRDLFVLPFVVLLATRGIPPLVRHAYRSVRVIAVLLLIAMPIQFAIFYHDYFNWYRTRAAAFFDPADFADLTRTLIAADTSQRVPVIFLSRILDDGSVRWRFHLTLNHRIDLMDRTRYFDGDGLDLGQAASDSLLVIDPDEHRLANLLATRKWTVRNTIVNVAGEPAAIILRKVSNPTE